MHLFRVSRSVLRTSLLAFVFPMYVFSQSPGGVNGQGFWYGEKDSSGIISNYHSVDLLKMSQGARDSIVTVPTSSSLFFVLRGNFSSAVEDTLLQIGDVTLIDRGVYHGRGFTSIDFNDSASKIVSVQTIRGHRLAKDTAPEINVGDLSKFSMAEVIYYPFALDRTERRLVNTYLSLKYAIPIIQGIEPDWKDYWAKDSSHYWDANKDKAFYLRVMGLGADSDQKFYQTQSIAETGKYFKIALDSPAVAGSMPRSWVAQEGFVIFAERKGAPTYTSGYCGAVSSGENPLERWKFKATDQWRTWATRIVIDVERPSGTIADSIYYTDGTNYYHAPWVYRDAKIIRYQVDLSNIQTGKNYMFTKRSSSTQSCDDVLVSDLGTGISVSGSQGMVTVHSLETGTTYESEFKDSKFVALGSGQYHVVVADLEGRDLFNELVAVGTKALEGAPSAAPSLAMYPNPVLTGRQVTVALSGFTQGPKSWQLVDALGRVILDAPVKDQTTISFDAPSPGGTYTFRLLTQEGIYSLKLISAQR